MRNHECKKSYLCFAKECREALCEECLSEHEEHMMFVVLKESLFKQLVESKNKYYTFTETIVKDMKQTLMLAAK